MRKLFVVIGMLAFAVCSHASAQVSGLFTVPVRYVQYMMGQSTACDLAQNFPQAAALLASVPAPYHPYIILTNEDPPYPGLDANNNPNLCSTTTINATVASWSPGYVIRWSAYDRYNTTPNVRLCPTASPPAPSPSPGSTPTPGPAGSDTGLCPDLTGQNSAGTVPSYVHYAIMDNELQTSQTTPVWETNAPAFYYPLAAAIAHAAGLKFYATGGLHLTSSTTSGYVAYPCYAHASPCTVDAANDTWEAIGCGVVVQNSASPCPTAVPSSQADGMQIQSQTGIGPGHNPVTLTSFLQVVHQDQAQLATVCSTNKCSAGTNVSEYSIGTGTLGNCDVCSGCKGLLTQDQMDAGAQNVAAGTGIWWNVGSHTGGTLCSGQNYTVNPTTCIFTTAGSGGIPGADCMAAQEVLNLQPQYFQPPWVQP